MSDTPAALAGADPEQARLMAERVILVTDQDAVVGHMSKAESHMVAKGLALHRAFSVFLFDSHGRMLLQKRASTKVTFPSFWTNTVCSHPLYVPAELGEEDGGNAIVGTKRAAIRKMDHELGIVPGALALDDLTYMTRIHYRAECDGGEWGEHEVDYIYMAQKDVELVPEPNEVEEVRYVTQEQLREMFAEEQAEGSTIRITPWFKHIVEGFAWPWWDALVARGPSGLSEFVDLSKVHPMGKCGPDCNKR